MTAEKIIERIKKDSEKEIKQIIQEAENQAKKVIANAKKEAEQESNRILSEGKQQGENIKKIMLSRANQDTKREVMNAREKLIEECFSKAYHKLTTLSETDYKKMVKKLIENGCNKLEGKCDLVISRTIDRKIAESMDLKVVGKVETAGGIIIKSGDGRITLDHTFDGILARKKDEIRRKVGRLLFS